MTLSRRHIIATGLASAAWATTARATTAPRVLGWDDLIPPGVPYGEIIGEGDLDLVRDTWSPVFDANAVKLNPELDGAYVRIPGFIIPLRTRRSGVKRFILVPYVGACIHVPPPPPNQLVFVKSKRAWPYERLWAPVWVEGTMRNKLQSTKLAQTGYAMTAEWMEPYQW